MYPLPVRVGRPHVVLPLQTVEALFGTGYVHYRTGGSPLNPDGCNPRPGIHA